MKKNLTKSFEDYLEAIYMFELKSKDKKVHSQQIAKYLGVSKPAVTSAMNKLIDDGLIEKELYGQILLTPKGREIALNVYTKHITLKEFLINIGVSEETASIDCCKIEHIISEETFNCIINFNKNLKNK